MDWGIERIVWRGAFGAQVGMTIAVTLFTVPTLLPLLGAPAGLLGPWVSLLVYTGIPAWPISAAVVQMLLSATASWYAWKVAQQLQGSNVDPGTVRRGLLWSIASLSFIAVLWWQFDRRIRDVPTMTTQHFMGRREGRRVGFRWFLVLVPCMAAMAGCTAMIIIAPAAAPAFLLVATGIYALGLRGIRRRVGSLDLHQALPQLAPDPFVLAENP